MALIVRIEGLPAFAGSDDILHFFSGLKVIDGGVHIVGGRLGEAFVIFATDEDTRRAMTQTGGLIRDSHVQIFLSSKAEMQKTMQVNGKTASDSIFGLKQAERAPAGDGFNSLPAAKKDEEGVYVYVCGLVNSATEEILRSFFCGLNVVDIIFFKMNNVKCGNAVVKFGSAEHGAAALRYNCALIDQRRITVKLSNERQWFKAISQVEDSDKQHPKPGINANPIRNSFPSQSPDKSKERTRSRSPHDHQCYIHLQNLPYNMTKEDVKNFIGDPEMENFQITFLLDKQNFSTSEAIIVLKSEQQQQECLTLHQSIFTHRLISVFPISLEERQQLLETHRREIPPKKENSQAKTSIQKTTKGRSKQKCMYVRNFPANVTKFDIEQFFAGFNVNQEDIFLLFDKNGNGMGEALVKFSTEHVAMLAESLQRHRFSGTEILLLRISEEQMKGFDVFH